MYNAICKMCENGWKLRVRHVNSKAFGPLTEFNFENEEEGLVRTVFSEQDIIDLVEELGY